MYHDLCKKLLTEERQTLKELTVAFGICRQTASAWLHSWNERGIYGLLNCQRSGRPPKLSAENQHQAIELVKEFPRSLKTVLAHLCELTGITLSCSPWQRRQRNNKSMWSRANRQ